MFSMTLWLLSVLVPLQILLGDLHGLNTLEHQPAKLAAIESHWETASRAPLTLFAIPDEINETNRYSVEIPVLGSLILAHDPNASIKGLKDWPPADRPPVAIPFFAFRIMVGIGIIMLGLVVTSWWLRFKGRLFETRWFLPGMRVRGPARLRRRGGRVDHHRGGPPALDRLWPAPHRGFGLSVADGHGRPDFPGRIYRGVSHHFPGGAPDHGPACPQRTGRFRGGREPSRKRQARPSGPHASSRYREAGAMNPLVLDTVPIWTLILGVGVFFYVLLDGFDLGVGMLFGLAPDTPSRNLVMNSIAPIWDGNETWLVLGGLALLAAFPLAFAIIIPAVYFPILVMLLALIFRGVAFEFRYRDAEHKTFWDYGFVYGSGIATFAQGMVLGAFIQGFEVQGRVFAGGSFDFLTPFSVLTGVALVFGYGLLGAGWLVLKTEGELQAWARRQGRWCFIGVVAAIGIVSLWTPFVHQDIAQRWFSWPNLLFLSPVPIVTALLAWAEWRSLNDDSEVSPFAGAIGLFVLAYLGIAISLWPNIVPHRFSLWEAASSESTQAFLLIGTLFLLPIILMYTGWSYWVFRGKVRADIGYH